MKFDLQLSVLPRRFLSVPSLHSHVRLALVRTFADVEAHGIMGTVMADSVSVVGRVADNGFVLVILVVHWEDGGGYGVVDTLQDTPDLSTTYSI